MKKAFTLAEALITVAIIGIVAVLLLPHLGNATPDENKIKFLKVYDALSQVVESLANDESLYARKLENKEKDADGKDITVTYDTSKYPLINFDKPTDSGYNYTNDTKFCNLLRDGLSGDQNVACSSSVTDLKYFNTKYNFSTQDGAAWLVQPYTGTDRLPTAEKDGKYYATVIVDINGVENGPNAQYNASTPNVVPDRFTFYVNGNGQVFPADEYSQMYIASRTVWNKKKSQNPAYYTAVSTDNNKNFEVPIAIRNNSGNGNDEQGNITIWAYDVKPDQHDPYRNHIVVSNWIMDYTTNKTFGEYKGFTPCKITLYDEDNNVIEERIFKNKTLSDCSYWGGIPTVILAEDESIIYTEAIDSKSEKIPENRKNIFEQYKNGGSGWHGRGFGREEKCDGTIHGIHISESNPSVPYNSYAIKCEELKDDENNNGNDAEYDFGYFELTFEYSKKEGTKIYARAVTALDEFDNDITKPCEIMIKRYNYTEHLTTIITDPTNKEKKLMYIDESTKGKDYNENESIIYRQSCSPQQIGGNVTEAGVTPKDFFGTNYAILYGRYYGK